MALAFRNITVRPADPVEQWGVEGILTAIERGGLLHLRRITNAITADPFGPVAQDFLEAAELTDSAVAVRMKALLLEAQEGEAAVVSRRVSDAIAVSGLSLREFADRIGTSASRLSTYATGRVQPSAAMFLRIENAAKSWLNG